MNNYIDLKNFKQKKINYLSNKFMGNSKKGDELKFTNYFMEINGKPFFAISGECHFSKVDEKQWEDSIIKMKMGGINIVSTYIFWNHHEEREGIFRFDGNKNLRKFIELCKKHNLYAIVRIGPFVHGEARNGGIPDWLYSKDFEVRSLEQGFLNATRVLYRELSKQLEGLYFSEDGPVIGTQIENEYMHSGAPWEMTTGISNEWVPGGNDGNEYMIRLKEIAQEEGISTPFYTCTGWGDAASPVSEMLPLWGGYAFWPWIFYDYEGEHPVTPEYIYRDNHNNDVRKTYNFEPEYMPESIPYACCEMGGGMACYYDYRFQLPFESVDAMANIKIGSGCNFLGYYIYRGGSHPKGELTPYLNEHQCPQISYDYQAPISEYAQLRPSYYRLKALNIFTQNFKNELCYMKTVLPANTNEMEPEDVDTLRYSIRTNGENGFIFINNYQDHIECKDKKNECIKIELKSETLNIDNIDIDAKEEAILPFNMNVGGYKLIYAKAQPLSIIDIEGEKTYFFFTPEGMKVEYLWSYKDIYYINDKKIAEDIVITPEKNSDGYKYYKITGKYGTVKIVTLTREESLMFYEIEKNNKKMAILSNQPLLYSEENIKLEIDSDRKAINFWAFPSCDIKLENKYVEYEKVKSGIWSGIKGIYNDGNFITENVNCTEINNTKYKAKVDLNHKCKYKNNIMQIDYIGDIGKAFVDSELVADNFANKAIWEIGLDEVLDREKVNEFVFSITPIKNNVKIDVSSTMAGRMENNFESTAKLNSIKIKHIEEIDLNISLI